MPVRAVFVFALCGAIGTIPVACTPGSSPGQSDAVDSESPPAGNFARIASPPAGTFYHGIYPGGPSGDEDDFTADDIRSYTDMVGKGVAWVYFSDNWFKSREFPLATAQMIRDRGAVPFVRLMLRSDSTQNHAEAVYTLEGIAGGSFNADLAEWGRAARDFATPLLVEWGTECNGEWFPWNGAWNGKDRTSGFGDPHKADGPERFVAAYRHIVGRIRAAGAGNVTFIWHVNNDDVPPETWNRLEEYYPGDDVVDWIAVSVYGPQTPMDADVPSFTASLDTVYPRLAALSPSKPILIAEFGCAANNPNVTSQAWADAALGSLFAGRWSRIIGSSWWNERWPNDGNPAHDTTMRVQDIPALADVFRHQLAAHASQVRTAAVVQSSPSE